MSRVRCHASASTARHLHSTEVGLGEFPHSAQFLTHGRQHCSRLILRRERRCVTRRVCNQPPKTYWQTPFLQASGFLQSELVLQGAVPQRRALRTEGQAMPSPCGGRFVSVASDREGFSGWFPNPNEKRVNPPEARPIAFSRPDFERVSSTQNRLSRSGTKRTHDIACFFVIIWCRRAKRAWKSRRRRRKRLSWCCCLLGVSDVCGKTFDATATQEAEEDPLSEDTRRDLVGREE